ncbi:M16 family metallopeptidase [Pseudoduganella violaceinigra]|uniref:M16 family metallopeptidase n=1 Tax=Pseudoduganella violaceinigra TaxID=246602 RepID=UPI0004100A20|nr:pitrilysin family protein [Pseudoduganella violaceinigra]
MSNILRFAVAAALAGAAAAPAFSAPAKAAAAAPTAVDLQPYSIPYKKFVLQNGLTLIVHTDHSVPLVGVNMWYHVGSRNEKRGKTGFAHLFEHFFFNGSENYPHGFREAMDDLGASNRNGTTSNDRTNFFEDVPVSALERTLYLEADRMGFLANYISKEMLERERGVVQNEKRQGENQPYGRVWGERTQHIYPYSHPYSWPVIGYMEDLNAASLDDVKEWYRTYYGPNNAVISLSGDITPERALELVKKYFDGIPAGPALARTGQWVPALERNIRDTMEDQVPQVRILRSFHIPGWGDADAQRLQLLSDVLAGSNSARLNKRLVFEKGLATSVGAEADINEIAGTFEISVTVKQGVDPAEAEREMEAVLKELLDKGPTAAELARVKTAGFAAFSRRIERLGGFGGRSDVLAESMTFGGAPDAYLRNLKLLADARPADVKASADKWLRANHYTMVVSPAAKLSVGATGIDRKLLPPLGAAPDVGFPAMQRATLSNGLKVILMERHGAPIVNVALAVDAGLASDTPAKAGLASLTLDLLDKGSKGHDAFQLSDALESQGARLSTGTQADQSLVRLNSTAQNLGASLNLMAEAVLAPTFPEDQFKLQKQRRLAQIGQEKANPFSLAHRISYFAAYGNEHPYGRSASGFEKTVEGLTHADLVKWHADWFKPGSATVIVSGDTTMDKLKPMLESSFGKWSAGSAPAKQAAPAASLSSKRVYLIDKPDAPQSLIIATHLSQPQGQPEDLAMEPVMQNFGGMATSRLNRNLRLDKHWSYGVSGALTNVRGQRSFVIQAPVQTNKTKESMQELAKEIKDIAGARPIAGEEYQSIMRNMTARMAGRFETLNALENAALQSNDLKRPDDYWAKYAGNIRALSEQQLAAAAPKYIKPEEVVWVVIGDVKKIEAGIRELNWGEIVHLDSDGKPLN